MKNPILTLLFAFATLLNACNSNDNDVEPVNELSQQPFVFNLDDVFELYSSLTNTEINGRVMSEDVPNFDDLVFELSIFSQTILGGFVPTEQYYYSSTGIINSETLVFNLEPNREYLFELSAYYMLNTNETLRANVKGLKTKQVPITNSILTNADVEATVTILDETWEEIDLSFGTHHLGMMFSLLTHLVAPDPSDTISFSLTRQTLGGPKLFDINIDNPYNHDIAGTILLEFEGLNRGPISVAVDTIPDEIFISYDYVSRMELFYNSPTGVKTSMMKKDRGLGGYDLVFFVLNVNIPKIETDANGEFISAIHSGT